MKQQDTNYRLTLRYGLISFLAVGLAAACILLFFRYQTVKIIEDASRQSNEVLTIATEYALNDHFIMLLNFIGQESELTNKNVSLEPALSKAIQKLLINTNVDRMKIYNTAGVVVFSTKSGQIGGGQEDNQGFINALKGETSTVLIYRDTFNLFDQEHEDANLVQTYVPIQSVTTGEVKGVFEIYSDISDYIYLSDRTILLVSIIVLSCMYFLYAFLLLHIKRSENIINRQNSETQEHNRMLEYLTAKMINAQEDERRRIAYELHEDVAQTISGVKMQLERYISDLNSPQEDDTASIAVSNSIVPVLQEVAQKIRMVAVDIRPPSLDDFGLKAAIKTLIAECHADAARIEVSLALHVDEEDLTMARKSILYRMIKDTLTTLCSSSGSRSSATIGLELQDGQLIMKIYITRKDDLDLGFDILPNYLESVKERTILSGGKFKFTRQGNAIESISTWSS